MYCVKMSSMVNGGHDESFETSASNSYPDIVGPSVEDGYVVRYEREVPIEIRSDIRSAAEGGHHTGILESIKVKMLVKGNEESPSSMRLELTSEADLFFSYVHEINDEAYRVLQDDQKLMVTFGDYPNVLIRMLNSIIREPHIHLGVLTMTADANNAHLDFIQNMEYKFVELMTCSFQRAPEEIVQQQITYRYNSMRQKLVQTQARLFEINHLVKTKNPSLLLHLQKGHINDKSPGRESSSIATPADKNNNGVSGKR